VLAFIGFGTAIAFGVLFRRADTEGNLLRARVAESEYQAAQLRAETEDQAMQVKRLEQQMANLAQEQEKQLVKPGLKPDASNLMGKMASALLSGLGAEKAGGGLSATPGDAQGAFMNAMKQMYSGEQGNEMARMTAEMTVNTQYGELFRQLQLAPDLEEQVRGILSRSLAEQIVTGVNTVGGGSWAELAQTAEEAKARTRAELAAVLSPEQMAEYDAYESTLPERILHQTFDGLLTQFAPDLTPESHDRTLAVLTEELLAAGAAQRGVQMPTAESVQQQFQIQQDAITRAGERLAQELTPEQSASVQRFLEQQSTMMRMFGEMMAPKEEAAPAGR